MYDAAIAIAPRKYHGHTGRGKMLLQHNWV